MLFNFYMRPLSEIIWSYGVCCHLCTDDMQPTLSFSSSAAEAVKTLEHYLDTVMDWTRATRLKLNPDKMEVLLLGGTLDLLGGCLPGLDRVTIPLKDQVRNLGVPVGLGPHNGE